MATNGSLEKLIRESRNLRDHLLRVEGQNGVPLGIALQPFEPAAGDPDPTDQDIAALSTEFQKAHDSALNSVDGYTLNEVLLGRSPHVYTRSALGSSLLTLMGVLLVGIAFFYSNWASRATFTISEAETFVGFDHFDSVMKLVELEAFFEDVNGDGDSPHLEPQVVYLEGLASLSAHYNDEVVLLHKMGELIEEISPYERRRQQLFVAYCRAEDPSQLPLLTRAVGLLFTCPPKPNTAGQSLSRSVVQQVAAAPQGFREQIEAITKAQRLTMESAGRRPLNDYVISFKKMQSQMQVLKDLVSVVHLWALPIIYGSLGSIVYCMWRVLNPNLSSLGGLYVIMRTAFAGLAALTLSMLLVPSNIFTVGVELNRPFIYLLSFIFGYSIEAFVGTLNTLNTYLSHNLTPRAGAAGGARWRAPGRPRRSRSARRS